MYRQCVFFCGSIFVQASPLWTGNYQQLNSHGSFWMTSFLQKHSMGLLLYNVKLKRVLSIQSNLKLTKEKSHTIRTFILSLALSFLLNIQQQQPFSSVEGDGCTRQLLTCLHGPWKTESSFLCMVPALWLKTLSESKHPFCRCFEQLSVNYLKRSG